MEKNTNVSSDKDSPIWPRYQLIRLKISTLEANGQFKPFPIRLYLNFLFLISRNAFILKVC